MLLYALSGGLIKIPTIVVALVAVRAGLKSVSIWQRNSITTRNVLPIMPPLKPDALQGTNMCFKYKTRPSDTVVSYFFHAGDAI